MRLRQTLLGAFGAASVALFAAQASGQEVFGAQLNRQLTPPEYCTANKGRLCSWVLRQAQGNAGKEKAPRNGRIAKIRLVACAPGGSFVLQVVRVGASGNTKVVRSGPVINYQGTSRNCNATKNFDVESFDVKVPVKKGDSLAVVATQVRFLYNSGSGPSALFDPPLAEGDGPRTAGDGSGFLMMQAELEPPG